METDRSGGGGRQEEAVLRRQPARLDAAWLGGALLADHKIGRHMASMWVTKDEYEEHGLTIAHRKLFPYN